jgi:hypothetical protein
LDNRNMTNGVNGLTRCQVKGPISTPVEASASSRFRRPGRIYLARARDLLSAEGRTPRVRFRLDVSAQVSAIWRAWSGRDAVALVETSSRLVFAQSESDSGSRDIRFRDAILRAGPAGLDEAQLLGRDVRVQGQLELAEAASRAPEADQLARGLGLLLALDDPIEVSGASAQVPLPGV